ncbi:hypothetical protein BGZ46_008952 [Entomortierella lignicola]|nr:hypothetical protein BGZ46_008952 [Entomortierella lignicola]
MQMRIVIHHKDSYLLEPVQSSIQGWLVRPGTFRVSQPYDKPLTGPQPDTVTSNDSTPINTPHSSPPIASPRARKRQKLSKKESEINSKNSENVLLEWIQSTFLDLLSQERTQSFIKSMQGDYFYGTCVDAPADDTFALDLVKLQPTLRLLKSGFASASSYNNDENISILFGKVQLKPELQQLELSDIYENLVVNDHSRPALTTFPMEGKPYYLIPPRSGFVVSDLDRIHGLKDIGNILIYVKERML